MIVKENKWTMGAFKRKLDVDEESEKKKNVLSVNEYRNKFSQVKK